MRWERWWPGKLRLSPSAVVVHRVWLGDRAAKLGLGRVVRLRVVDVLAGFPLMLIRRYVGCPQAVWWRLSRSKRMLAQLERCVGRRKLAGGLVGVRETGLRECMSRWTVVKWQCFAHIRAVRPEAKVPPVILEGEATHQGERRAMIHGWTPVRA